MDFVKIVSKLVIVYYSVTYQIYISTIHKINIIIFDIQPIRITDTVFIRMYSSKIHYITNRLYTTRYNIDFLKQNCSIVLKHLMQI